MAIELRKRKASPAEAVSSLAARWHLSKRQAYRYLRQAEASPTPVPIPETKTVFTVKLPPSLIAEVRRKARSQDQSISELVARALTEFLRKQKPRRHG